MLQLNSHILSVGTPFTLKRTAFLLSKNPDLHPSLKERQLFILAEDSQICPLGFAGYITFDSKVTGPYNTIHLPATLKYLEDGDVAIVDPDRKVFRTQYRRSSPNNSFLLTERCNHYCVMCSQPPRTEDDSYLARDVLECIPLVSQETVEIGFTGGEPTLLGEMFLELVRAAKVNLPRTSLHVLSNGRNFADQEFAASLGRIKHHDLMMGIPIYSDDPTIHNFVVQSSNALDGTLNGILNLKAAGVKVEIRIVLHRHTIPTLVSLAEFIVRNLVFVDHVAFMGLEAMGFAKSNWDDLWIDPKQYQPELKSAVEICRSAGLHVSIYNLPLCWIDLSLTTSYRRSISDWKNEYDEECENCAATAHCGGFFSSNLKAGAATGVRRLSAAQVRGMKF